METAISLSFLDSYVPDGEQGLPSGHDQDWKEYSDLAYAFSSFHAQNLLKAYYKW